MEIRRATELVICSLLQEALPGISFYPSGGGGDDFTPVWQANHIYIVGNLLRPTNATKTHALVVTVNGTSGPTEPNFTDVVGSIVTSGATFKTTPILVLAGSSPVPPYATVVIEKANKILSIEETSFLVGRITWITRMSQTDALTHSTSFKQIYDAMGGITKGFDAARSLIIHGVDVLSAEEFGDDARQGRGDSLLFCVGVTEVD